jgi:hypothetical protein
MTKLRGLLSKSHVLLIIFLFVSMSIVSSSGIIIKKNCIFNESEVYQSPTFDGNDTTAPVTDCLFEPSEPDGDNGWYVSNVSVELIATDDISGVKEIRISICGDPEIVVPGDNVHFFFNEDYKDYYIDYWAVDFAGNVESKNRFYINLDKTKPDISHWFEVYYQYPFREFRILLSATATDSTSEMDRVEFFRYGVHKETVIGPGKRYWWSWKPTNYQKIKGFIRIPEINEEHIKFYSIFVMVEFSGNFGDFYAYGYDKAGNMNSDDLNDIGGPIFHDFLLLQNVTIPNNYTGYIGRFCINVRLNT